MEESVQHKSSSSLLRAVAFITAAEETKRQLNCKWWSWSCCCWG